MLRLKRILVIALAFLMLTAASVPAKATYDEDATLRSQITHHYFSAVYSSGKETLGGYCGLMTSWQLYLMGVNTSLQTNDGNQQYDYYENMEYTTGGYRVKSYPAEHYTLEEALYAATGYGTRDAYNLIVGFQWTNTAAGAYYGHAVVIYAILDGMVYFTEGFSTSLGTSEGQAIVISIPEFVRYYDDWTLFEGVIEFGKKDLAYTCTQYAADSYYGVVEDVEMLSQPTTEPEEAQVVRSVRAGEHLYVTGIYENEQGQYFCQVSDCGIVGYIPGEMLELLTMRQILPTVHKADLPQRVEKGVMPGMEISLALPENAAAELRLYDTQGQILKAFPMEQNKGCFQASGDVLGITALEEGAYRVRVVASREQTVLLNGAPVALHQQETVLELPLCIGADAAPLEPAPAEPFADGWNYRNNNWYYYKDGAPYVGWLCDQGIDYYLQEDGSVTTGWTEVLGKPRYFSDLGVMRTGWLEDSGNTYYLMCNGVPAQGWREIDGKDYYFAGDGEMCRNTWLEDEDKTYFLQIDGTPLANGWYETDRGLLSFHVDGFVDAQWVDQDGQSVIVPYTQGDMF